MLSISRILMPVDFSDRCLAMTAYVKAIAQTYKAEVTLVHVVNPFYEIPQTGISGPTSFPISRLILEQREKQLEEFAIAELEGVPVRRVVYEGDPASQIVEFARAEPIDLIAMPTHGYGPLRRFLIGSNTAKVLHDTHCPVLTGSHVEQPAAPARVSFSKVLCAVDLGPQSPAVLDWAVRLAGDFHAQLGIVHAISPQNPSVALLLSPEFEMEIQKKIRAEIERLQAAAGADDATIYIEEGQPGRTVSAVAKSSGADLLVIGRGPVEEAGRRFTTNAYAIIRQAPCAVISI